MPASEQCVSSSYPHLIHFPKTDVTVMPVRMVNYLPASPHYCLPGWFVKFSCCCAFSHPGRRDSWFKEQPDLHVQATVVDPLWPGHPRVLPRTLTWSAALTIPSAGSTGRY